MSKEDVKRDKIDNLFKGRSIKPSVNKRVEFSRSKIKSICKSLSYESGRYDPDITIKIICSYLSGKNKIDRILYSEISNYIFSLDMEQRGVFATNVDNLLQKVLDDCRDCSDGQKEDCRKIVIKSYDHFQLALHQIENVKNILSSGTQELRDEIRKENKGIEREYITILAIFSSIVVTFIGGLNFSENIMQGINSTSLYRLFISMDFLGFIIINLSYMMIKLIFEINDKKITDFDIKKVNWIFLWIAVVIILGWLIGVHDAPDYIREAISSRCTSPKIN